jgi:hypothetical protein
LLYVFLVLSPDRRRVVHFNVTANPSAEWTGQQMIEAFPFDTAPRYLIRGNDRIYDRRFSERIEGMGIEEIPIAQHSPWQNPYVERMIGTIRRECLDHVIVLGERRTSSQKIAGRLLRLRSPSAAASVTSRQRASAARGRVAGTRVDRLHAAGRRPASSLRSPRRVVHNLLRTLSYGPIP